MTSDDSQLDELFERYRDSCPEIEPDNNFMPRLWRKIESRHNFWFVFQRQARTATTVCAALCLVLLALNFSSPAQNHRATATYTDALLAEHSAEKTYYAEAISPAPAIEESAAKTRH